MHLATSDTAVARAQNPHWKAKNATREIHSVGADPTRSKTQPPPPKRLNVLVGWGQNDSPRSAHPGLNRKSVQHFALLFEQPSDHWSAGFIPVEAPNEKEISC